MKNKNITSVHLKRNTFKSLDVSPSDIHDKTHFRAANRASAFGFYNNPIQDDIRSFVESKRNKTSGKILNYRVATGINDKS